MLIIEMNLMVFMSWFKSTNAKEIGTLYLIFAVMIGTAFSVSFLLELVMKNIHNFSIGIQNISSYINSYSLNSI